MGNNRKSYLNRNRRYIFRENFSKYGIIEKYDKDKIILKEIGKNSGVFIATSEIAIDEITFLNLRNTKIK